MRLRKLALLFAGLFLGLGVYAQQAPGAAAGQAGFFPYVSDLKGEVRNNLLRLTWLDSPDLKGSVFIYRSLSSFNGNTSLSAGDRRPVEIPYGTQSYIDEIDNSATYYYFVAASDTEGNHYIGFTPGNTLSVEIPESMAVPAIRVPVREPDPIVTAQGVSGLRARVDGNSVVVSFRNDSSGNLVLYRGISPITRTSDLLSALSIKGDAQSPFIDNPVPGIPYYYAVIPEDELIRGTATIVPGINATVEPAQISTEARTQAASVRNVPLPLISPAIMQPSSYEASPRQGELSAQAEKALENIPSLLKDRTPPKNSHIFPRDMDVETEVEGEDYLLFNIVQSLFLIEEWEMARDEFTRYLSLPRSAGAEARARYYLGQCYYFLHEPGTALFEFLKTRPVYPDESTEWIQASLNMMVE